MNKTKIEWCDYTWNTVTGCKKGCWYCYGKRIRERFNPDIPWSQLIHFDERLEQPLKVKKPSKIFVGSMADLFAEWAYPADVKNILDIVKQCPQHTFIFLTKSPINYNNFKFPENCWLGMTQVGQDSDYRQKWVDFHRMDNIRFVSIEPLLGHNFDLQFQGKNPDWIIVGGLTPKPCHRDSWVDDIVGYAKKRNIPIFLKNNLNYPKKIQEFPIK